MRDGYDLKKNIDVIEITPMGHCLWLLDVAKYFRHSVGVPRPTRVATPEQWRVVGQHVNGRRRELGISSLKEAALRGGGTPSDGVWAKVERGRPDNNRLAISTLDAVCRVLKWTPDSIDRLLDGRPPADVETVKRELAQRIYGADDSRSQGDSQETPGYEERLTDLERRVAYLEAQGTRSPLAVAADTGASRSRVARSSHRPSGVQPEAEGP